MHAPHPPVLPATPLRDGAPTHAPASFLRRPRAVLATALCVALLSGCATSTPPAAAPGAAAAVPDTPLQLPAALRVEGVPPLTQAATTAAQRYSQVLGHGLADWHPQRREMLVLHRQPGASTTQLFLLRSPLGALEPLTEGADPVSSASWEPRQGRYVVFSRSRGGNEEYQLFRLDPNTRSATQITPDGQRHALAAWLPRRGEIVVASVPVDRTAAGGTRSQLSTTLTVVDPQNSGATRALATLPGGGWFGGTVSPDETQMALVRYVSVNESELWLVDLANGGRRQLLPAAGERVVASHFPVAWTPDGRSLFLLSDRASEFRELMRMDLASGALTRLSAHIPWDLSGGRDDGEGAAGRWLVMTANVDGRDELRLFDPATGAEVPLPAGMALPAGSVGQAQVHPATGEIGMVVSSSRGPAQVHVVNLGTRSVQPWTRPVVPAGLDLSTLPEPRVVRWTSFDGLAISGVLYMPPARFGGKRPVYMQMHGGPEAQSKLGWRGRLNYLVQELGIAVLEPNVRGSTGYGKTFVTLDNGRKREDSVKDMASAIDWIATQPGLDASRVVVAGGSYGGYMALAASVRLADRIAGAYSSVGISNFVTFLERTETYRRDLRRVEYGDERDPAMREFLLSISPLTLADNITKPLMVSQGKNDPRVPWTESEQIVRRLQARGQPVWYLLADNEGHGFARRENADYAFAALLKFLEATVLKPR